MVDCRRCRVRPAIEGGYCYFDIRYLARRAGEEYALQRRAHTADRAASIVREMVEVGHFDHEALVPGCKFCPEST